MEQVYHNDCSDALGAEAHAIWGEADGTVFV